MRLRPQRSAAAQRSRAGAADGSGGRLQRRPKRQFDSYVFGVAQQQPRRLFVAVDGAANRPRVDSRGVPSQDIEQARPTAYLCADVGRYGPTAQTHSQHLSVRALEGSAYPEAKQAPPVKEPHYSKRVKLTGKGKAPTFLGIPHYIIDSAEWGALSGNGAKLLIDLARQYQGRNNGNFEATWERMSARGWASKATVQKTLQSLESDGWIFKTRQGGRDRRCSLYAVTWWSIDADGERHSWPIERVARHSWRKSTAPKNGAVNPIENVSTSPVFGAGSAPTKNTPTAPVSEPHSPKNWGSGSLTTPKNGAVKPVF